MSFPNTVNTISVLIVLLGGNSIAWLYFKASGFLFVLVPVSISSKITVVRIDSVRGRRGLLILRKCILWQFVMSVGLTKTAPHFWSGWCYLVDCLFSVAFGRWKIQSPGWDTGREWRDLFLKKQNIKKKKKSWFLSPAVWLLHNWELNCTKSLLYTQLNYPLFLLVRIHMFAHRLLIWIVLRNLRWLCFLIGYFVIYIMGGGESAIIVWSVTTWIFWSALPIVAQLLISSSFSCSRLMFFKQFYLHMQNPHQD